MRVTTIWLTSLKATHPSKSQKRSEVAAPCRYGGMSPEGSLPLSLSLPFSTAAQSRATKPRSFDSEPEKLSASVRLDVRTGKHWSYMMETRIFESGGEREREMEEEDGDDDDGAE